MSAPNPDSAVPNRHDGGPARGSGPPAAGPVPAAGDAPARFDDRPLMVVGSLAFGLAIPWLTGLYGPLRPPQPLWWLGQALFVALAFAIWGGNRWLLFKQREHWDWFGQPLRKLLMLVTANVLYTAPVTLAGLAAWFALAGLPVDAAALQVVTLTNVICVLFVTHAYETLFLIRERESDRVQVERLERLRSQAELGALRAQVDPHFLFNSLNTLGHLIRHDPARGREFCDLLAEVYRYVLAARERDLVPLAEEIAFLRGYHRLLALRFGDAIRLDLDDALLAASSPGSAGLRIVPMGLQTLLENAVKHNQAPADAPLQVSVRRSNAGSGSGAAADSSAGSGASVRVSNPLRPRLGPAPGGGLGLNNLDERCRGFAGRGIVVRAEAGRFEVEVPLVAEEPAR